MKKNKLRAFFSFSVSFLEGGISICVVSQTTSPLASRMTKNSLILFAASSFSNSASVGVHSDAPSAGLRGRNKRVLFATSIAYVRRRLTRKHVHPSLMSREIVIGFLLE